MKNKLDAYRGKLTPRQIAKGMTAAAVNARRLANDASALLEAHRYPTAGSLAVLAIEEAGKSLILRTLALAKTNAEVLDAWAAYRSHTKKNVLWLLPMLVASGARKLDDFASLFDPDSDHPYLLDHIKQLGFYTDCLGKAHWSIPDDVIDEDLARMLVKVADLLAHGHDHTQKEIELWIEHVGPVWKRNPKLMKQAVGNWYAAMMASGLRRQGANEMKEFAGLVERIH